MATKVFVDGQEGTTGLQIHDRLKARKDLTILEIDPDKRKDLDERKRLIHEADIVFLCLPDDAARESVQLAEGSQARIIDASTAFRTSDDWTYGFPELHKDHRKKIKESRRISNPGCHATGFVAAVHPLVRGGIIAADYEICSYSLTGYSGGGKKLIASHEQADPMKKKRLSSPRPYALGLRHKHIPEMAKRAGLTADPVFSPVVGDFYKGMAVSALLPVSALAKKMTAFQMREFFAEYYAGEPFIRVMPFEDETVLDENFLDIQACNGTNFLDIFVFGHETQIMVTSRLDNLGKGASGAAVQNMNIMIGADERTGL
jgi:N-acetyl-gamma-glutamyl-phosphate reductase